MSLIENLHGIINDAKAEYENAEAGSFSKVSQSKKATGNGTLVKGDNIKWMKHMLNTGYKEKINLIYIDPPFFSGVNYDAIIKIESDKVRGLDPIKLYAYHDIWGNGMEGYLRSLCARLYLMRDLLTADGCIWVHLDWHASHYVKIIMDEVFGEKNFINEIIWNYKSGGTSKRHFARKHDTLLLYSKTGKYYFKPQSEKSYNRGFRPYRFKGVKEYKDDLGWYTMVNMKDVWQIDMVGRTSAERTGYATQKPEALLERIMESSSREGDICADFFSGSGTLASVAHKNGRKWVSCDAGSMAFAAAGKRLTQAGADYIALEQTDGINAKAKCTVSADVIVRPIELSDRVMLSINLISYDVGLDAIPLDTNSEKMVKKIIKADPLRLIDYWSIDFSFDGEVHSPDIILFSSRDKNYGYEKIGSSFDRISIQVVDVFGNSTFLVKDSGK